MSRVCFNNPVDTIKVVAVPIPDPGPVATNPSPTVLDAAPIAVKSVAGILGIPGAPGVGGPIEAIV